MDWLDLTKDLKEAKASLGLSAQAALYARLLGRVESMAVIEQAKGIIMAQSRCSPDEAFEILRRTSQRGNVKVRDLAALVVVRAQGLPQDSATLSDLATVNQLLYGARRGDERAEAACRAVRELVGPDMSDVQILDLSEGSLYIGAHHGFRPGFLNYFACVTDDRSACGVALLQHDLVVVDDVANNPIFDGTTGRDVMLEAGSRAVESLPYFDREGQLRGVISMHHGTPGNRPARELTLLRLIAGRLGALWD